jgi:DNA-binding MarR family transcriptional regulator
MTSPSIAPDLADRLHRVLVRLLRALAREDEALGLSRARLSALSVLEFGGPLSLGELARREAVQPPTMSRLIAALEQEGLVVREADAADRRQIRLRTTPEGSRLMQQGRGQRARALATRLGRLSVEELAELAGAVGLLERLLAD